MWAPPKGTKPGTSRHADRLGQPRPNQLAKLQALMSEGFIDHDQYRQAKAKLTTELHKQRETKTGAVPGQKVNEGPASAPDALPLGLPDPWISISCELSWRTGPYFYYNTATGDTAWSLPGVQQQRHKNLRIEYT